jgi:hypothetical protein
MLALIFPIIKIAHKAIIINTNLEIVLENKDFIYINVK